MVVQRKSRGNPGHSKAQNLCFIEILANGVASKGCLRSVGKNIKKTLLMPFLGKYCSIFLSLENYDGGWAEWMLPQRLFKNVVLKKILLSRGSY